MNFKYIAELESRCDRPSVLLAMVAAGISMLVCSKEKKLAYERNVVAPSFGSNSGE